MKAFAARAGYEMVGTLRETASGARTDRTERRKVLALAQRREIDAALRPIRRTPKYKAVPCNSTSPSFSGMRITTKAATYSDLKAATITI